MYAKYRFVPRSAIVDYEGLLGSVRTDHGRGDLHDLITQLWQRHGAPSRAVVDAYLDAARELDERRSEACDDDRRRLLEAWARECAPRSAAGRLRDHAELVLCFLLRRARQYIYAAWAVVAPSARRG
jgi:hypothetical protein